MSERVKLFSLLADKFDWEIEILSTFWSSKEDNNEKIYTKATYPSLRLEASLFLKWRTIFFVPNGYEAQALVAWILMITEVFT